MDVKHFLQDPTTLWLLYGLAALFILDWIVLRLFLRRRSIRASGRAVAVDGDNPGIIVTGKAGNITQQRVDDGSRSGNPEHLSGAATRVLGIAANVSGILGLLFAALGFYLDHWG